MARIKRPALTDPPSSFSSLALPLLATTSAAVLVSPYQPPTHPRNNGRPNCCAASVVSPIEVNERDGVCVDEEVLRSSVIFLLHIALDVPIAVQGLWSPFSMPFLQLNNTAVVFVKVRRCL